MFLCLPYPFTAPSAIPVTKYFCRNGYTIRIGTVEMTVIAHRIVTGVVIVVDFSASTEVCAAFALFCVVASFIFRIYCRVYRSASCPQYR